MSIVIMPKFFEAKMIYDDNHIIIPKFFEAKPFFNNKAYKALETLQSKGYAAQFIPEIIDSRIISDKDNAVWTDWYCAPSLKVTGTTKKGSRVVVYAHVPNYYSNPKNIQKALSTNRVGAEIFPEKELHRLIEMEDGERVLVADYKSSIEAKSGMMSVDEALENIHTIPFIGGKTRAENYLLVHKEIFGNIIGVNHSYSDEMDSVPRARLLFVGCRDGTSFLISNNEIYNNGRFLGIRSEAPGIMQITLGGKK